MSVMPLRPALGPWWEECGTVVHTLLGAECLRTSASTPPISPMVEPLSDIPVTYER